MTFKYRYRKQIIIGIFITILIISTTTLIFINLKNNDKEETEEILVEKKEEKEKDNKKESTENPMLKVDIKGEINNPGIYSLIESSRIIDAIELAGGLTENADTSVINLSKKIRDEMVIIIYSHEQIQNFKETKEQEKYLQEKCNEQDENALTNDACITSSEQVTTKININTATKEELMTIKGIGEAKADDIISYRESNGGFNSIEEIQNISGIGENLFDKIKENITT